MDPTPLLSQVCTIQHTATTSTTDEYGNATTVTTTSTARCWLYQQQRSDETAPGPLESERWKIIVEPSAALDADDAVVVDGVTFQVIGPPWRANNPRLHRVTHIEADLQRKG